MDIEFTDNGAGSGSYSFADSNTADEGKWRLVYIAVIIIGALLFFIRRLNH